MAAKQSASIAKKGISTAADTAAKVAKAAAKKAEASADFAEKSASRAKTFEKKAEVMVAIKPIHGFIEFLREQSVVGLAIGLVLGTQAKALVDQLMASFINPLVGLLLPGNGTLKDKAVTLHWHGKVAIFGWGAFVVGLLTFVIVAAVVYFVFKGLKLDKLDKQKKVA